MKDEYSIKDIFYEKYRNVFQTEQESRITRSRTQENRKRTETESQRQKTKKKIGKTHAAAGQANRRQTGKSQGKYAVPVLQRKGTSSRSEQGQSLLRADGAAKLQTSRFPLFIQ